VAASLDGFIAGPKGEYDWIVMDPAIDFDALYKEFDTVVMGRKTYQMMTAHGGTGAMPGVDVVVFSRTLAPKQAEGIRITKDSPARVVAALKKKAGRDIWLFGGGELFRSLLDAGLVDTVEVAVMPVMIGSGVPLLPPGAINKLVLADQKVLKGSGIVVLSYTAPRGRAARIRYVKAARKRVAKKTGSRNSTARKRR
jgi:dihydrofolate reductase